MTMQPHTDMLSHPTGVRGLKYHGVERLPKPHRVAPHWGAWIEMLT